MADSFQPHTREEMHGLIHPPPKNCCTWKVAAVFLTAVALGLVLTWVFLPAEDIVADYIPKFEQPQFPYVGDETGDDSSSSAPADQGEAGGVPLPPPDVGPSIPSFMQCPVDSVPNTGGAGEGPVCCNGSLSNCNLRLNDMMFAMVHNAMSAQETGFFAGYNHLLGLEKALINGYRGINLDVCNCDGQIQFCHNACDFGERYPDEVFANILQFLTDFPTEVVVLLFQASEDQGPIIWNDLHAEMSKVSGFTDLLYVHPGYGSEWPLMSDLVLKNERIIVFYFNDGTCNNGKCPSGFHYFYDYAGETEFQSASLADLNNVETSCKITRGLRKDADFFVVNNFVTPPDEILAKKINGQEFLADRITKCSNFVGMRANFVYLDFWSIGVTAELVQRANTRLAQDIFR